MIWMGVLFFAAAYLYSMVGFGGASSYTALLALFSAVHYQQIPLVALACNIVVVSGNTYHFNKTEGLPLHSLIPFLVASMPMAFIGGMIPVSQIFYKSLLGGLLLFASLKIFVVDQVLKSRRKPNYRGGVCLKLLIGGSVGFAAGLTGIGGGIILAPALYLMGWGRPKTIAAACSIFILINSLTGIAGQSIKVWTTNTPVEAKAFLLIFIVFIGGQLGVRKTCKTATQARVKTYTGVLLLVAAIRLQTPLFKMLWDNL